ncbi:MAG: esterase-like activity of phytase family protein [Caldiserica bacterium]|nr:esterase-like activity of phytase family protein [Caldisericota bacterium]
MRIKALAILALFGLWAVAGAVELKFLGSYEIETEDWWFGTMPVGEISGLAYNPDLGIYYGICDNRGKDPEEGTAGRLYLLDIDLGCCGIYGVRVVSVVFLDSDPEAPRGAALWSRRGGRRGGSPHPRPQTHHFL